MENKVGHLVDQYMREGVIVGAIVADDVRNPDVWGRPLTDAEIDEMAGYWHAWFPGIPTWVRRDAAGLDAGSIWLHLDGALSHYKAALGDLEAWIAKEEAAYARSGLRKGYGMNTHDGGLPNLTAMSAGQIVTIGTRLARIPGLRLLLAWRYDANEMDPARVAAHQAIVDTLAAR
jgi:hypothetical protein